MIDSNEIDYVVVVNDEGFYSIWPAQKTPPAGWRTEPMCGRKSDCLSYIETHWTDMRPARLRTDAKA